MDFARDKSGKIAKNVFSEYGLRQLRLLQGTDLHFTDVTATVKGKTLVDPSGKVLSHIKGDRDINKIIFKIL